MESPARSDPLDLMALADEGSSVSRSAEAPRDRGFVARRIAVRA
jgi:hypothetical protein